MRKLVSAIILSFIFICSYSQSPEISISINSSLSGFTGSNVETVSFINYDDQFKNGYTNNPYGKTQALGLGISASIKKRTAEHVFVGAELGYETLKSKVDINNVYVYSATATNSYTASGKTFLKSSFINLAPFLGYRVKAGLIDLDFSAGVETAFTLTTKEDGEATASNGIKYQTSLDRKTIKVDVRPRIQIAVGNKKLGGYVGYSVGVSNYRAGTIGSSDKCYSRILRFGATYKI